MNSRKIKTQGQSSLVPLTPKIDNYEARLYQSKQEIGSFVKLSEGLFFKFIGLDGLIGIIPGVGAIYTACGGFWLLSQSGRVRADFADKATILALTVVDICIGLVPGLGDAIDFLFRSHAWNGHRLIERANSQLAMIEQTRSQIANGHNPDLKALEESLFL